MLPCNACLSTHHFYFLKILLGKHTLVTKQDLHQSMSANFITEHDLRLSASTKKSCGFGSAIWRVRSPHISGGHHILVCSMGDILRLLQAVAKNLPSGYPVIVASLRSCLAGPGSWCLDQLLWWAPTRMVLAGIYDHYSVVVHTG